MFEFEKYQQYLNTYIFDKLFYLLSKEKVRNEFASQSDKIMQVSLFTIHKKYTHSFSFFK